MQSVEPWRAAVPVVRALQLPIFAPNHDYNDEDDEGEEDHKDDKGRMVVMMIICIWKI